MTDFELQLEQRLWAILEAHNGFSSRVDVRNRIKLCEGKPRPTKTNVNDSDYPECLIFFESGSASLYSLEPNYTMRPGFNPATAAWTEDLDLVAIIEVTHKDLDRVKASPLCKEIVLALRMAGPTLGMTITDGMVMPVGPVRWRNAIEAEGSTERLITRITVPVRIRLKSSQLK